MTTTRDRIGLLVVLAVATAAHLTYGAWVKPIVWADSVRYAELAVGLPERLRTGNWDTWTVPGYPALVWAVGRFSRRVEGLVLLQQFVSVATAGIAWAAVRRLFGAWPALVGGLLFAVSPVRHYYAQAVLTEALSEAVFVAGFAAATFSLDAVARRRIALRVLAGALFGLATLVRPNLLVAIAIAAGIPVVEGGRVRFAATLAAGTATALAAALVLAPWLAFNERRDVHGLTGNAGYNLNLFANLAGLEPKVDLAEWEAGGYTPGEDRELGEIGRRRMLAHPIATLRAMGLALESLTFWGAQRGDVAPWLPDCTFTSGDGSLPGIDRVDERTDDHGRCDVHRALLRPMHAAATIGWVAVALFGLGSARRRRWDRAALALLPIAPVLALAAMLLANTRYGSPLEGIALAVGWGWLASFALGAIGAAGALPGPARVAGIRADPGTIAGGTTR